jgi:hypothetical protein
MCRERVLLIRSSSVVTKCKQLVLMCHARNASLIPLPLLRDALRPHNVTVTVSSSEGDNLVISNAADSPPLTPARMSPSLPPPSSQRQSLHKSAPRGVPHTHSAAPLTSVGTAPGRTAWQGGSRAERDAKSPRQIETATGQNLPVQSEAPEGKARHETTGRDSHAGSGQEQDKGGTDQRKLGDEDAKRDASGRKGGPSSVVAVAKEEADKEWRETRQGSKANSKSPCLVHMSMYIKGFKSDSPMEC